MLDLDGVVRVHYVQPGHMSPPDEYPNAYAAKAATPVPRPPQVDSLPPLRLLQSVFHLKQEDAAKAIGRGLTTFKKLCRQNGIKRWPYRKVNGMKKVISSFEQVRARTPRAL